MGGGQGVRVPYFLLDSAVPFPRSNVSSPPPPSATFALSLRHLTFDISFRHYYAAIHVMRCLGGGWVGGGEGRKECRPRDSPRSADVYLDDPPPRKIRGDEEGEGEGLARSWSAREARDAFSCSLEAAMQKSTPRSYARARAFAMEKTGLLLLAG